MPEYLAKAETKPFDWSAGREGSYGCADEGAMVRIGSVRSARGESGGGGMEGRDGVWEEGKQWKQWKQWEQWE